MNFTEVTGKITDYKNSEIVVLPVPFEFSTSYIKGTGNAPQKIIEASQQLELYDYDFDYCPVNKGIHTSPSIKCSGTVNQVFTEIETKISNILDDNKFPIIIGGEHSISFPVYKSIKKKINDIGIIHFDAHSDLRYEYEGTKFSHASVMRRIREIENNTLSIGIRSVSEQEIQYIKEQNIKIYFTEESQNNPEKIKKSILNSMPEKIYITLDFDVFDPSVIPAVGTPQPNGLNWQQITDYLYFIFKNKNVVGIDFVELCPRKNDINSDFICSKLIYKTCAMKFYL
jgi:agmatinase